MLCPIRPLLLLRLLLWCFAWLRGFLLPPNRFLEHGFETTELIRFEISRIAVRLLEGFLEKLGQIAPLKKSIGAYWAERTALVVLSKSRVGSPEM